MIAANAPEVASRNRALLHLFLQGLMKTFDETDQFDLKDFSVRLNAFVAMEHYFVEGGLVLSLNGPFGAGKTTFLEMWRNDLLQRRKQDDTLPLPIVLNAWDNDYCGDPLFSLVNGLSAALSQSKDEGSKAKSKKLREAAKDVAWFAVGLAGGVASHLSGIDPIAAGKLAEGKKRDRESPMPPAIDILSLYEARRTALSDLKAALRETFGGKRPKALVMVDELDRCRPSYAIDFLETIKHVFDVHGLVFVLAVDKSQLRSSAKALFGDINFDEYYRKFVHRNVNLPFPSDQGVSKLANSLAQTVLEVTDKEFTRSSILDIRDRLRDIIDVSLALRLTPRQMHELFRSIGYALECAPDAPSQKLLWGYAAGSILLGALSVAKPELYHRVGQRLAESAEFVSFLKLFSIKNRQWWGLIIVFGYTTDEQQEEAFLKDFAKEEIVPEEFLKEDNQRRQQFALGFGSGHNSGFRVIYDVLEGVKRFL
jgi:hypothetical protein